MNFWNESRVIAGQLVSRATCGGGFSVPCIIGFAAGGEGVYLTYLSDGMILGFDTKQELAEYLNNGDFIPVSKLIGDGQGASQSLENRIGLPVVSIQSAT